MRDIVLVTIDSVRRDFLDDMDHLSSMTHTRGTAVGHYTRPSLAGVLSSQYEAALRKQVVGPSVADVLSGAGYTCIGLTPTPQADPAFGFDRGFDSFDNFYRAGSRGSRYRDYIAQFGIARRLYHRIAPPHAKLDDLPTDRSVVDEAIDRFNGAESPRFLWVHLNGAHRPYGRAENGIPKSLDRKALFAPGRLTEQEHEEIISAYRRALARTDRHLRELIDGLEADPMLVVTSDHGDEFGEDGHYFHQPQRRRVADPLIEVPVALDGLGIKPSWVSLIDIAPTVVSSIDLDVPGRWDGVDLTSTSRDHAVTIAPWLDEATIAYQSDRAKIVARGADPVLETAGRGDMTGIEAGEMPDHVRDRLRTLGYAE